MSWTQGTDAYGIPSNALSQGTSTATFGYAGDQADKQTGFSYLRAKMYDPLIGRFYEADPLKEAAVPHPDTIRS